MSARDVIARATCGDRDVEGWIPCTECEENAERVVAAVDSMSTEDLADLLRNRIRQMTLTINVALDGEKVAEAVRWFGGGPR